MEVEGLTGTGVGFAWNANDTIGNLLPDNEGTIRKHHDNRLFVCGHYCVYGCLFGESEWAHLRKRTIIMSRYNIEATLRTYFVETNTRRG